MDRKKYCMVGTGGRGIWMYGMPIARDYSGVAELVGLYDVNPRRAEFARKTIGIDVPVYADFDSMVRDSGCDVVIVTSKDSTHHDYIIRSLEQGKDIITEKPMTTDDEKCRAILEAERRTGRRVTVTFNYRFVPHPTRIKELLKAGLVGDIFSVDFHWHLNTLHGADYYRRWHAHKRESGGLLVHKATHHFDMVNWFLDQEPKTVYAKGKLRYYGPNRDRKGERCLGCRHAGECEFYIDMRGNRELKELYLDAEEADGYFRDRCVFRESIDIEDTMAVLVEYSGGVLLTYSLNSYLPVEGWRMAINGSKGRLECFEAESFVPVEEKEFASRTRAQAAIDPEKAAGGDLTPVTEDVIRFYPIFGGVQTIPVKRNEGGHGGGDARLLDMLFIGGQPDPLGHMAGSRAGAMSILIGVGANKSIATGCPVEVADLLR